MEMEMSLRSLPSIARVQTHLSTTATNVCLLLPHSPTYPPPQTQPPSPRQAIATAPGPAPAPQDQGQKTLFKMLGIRDGHGTGTGHATALAHICDGVTRNIVL